MKVLPATPVKKVGAKGETAFYYGPDISVSRSWNINGKRVCDLIADGRQTVLPPTVHPDTGAPYRWVGDPLDLYDPDELPFLSADTIGNIDAVLIPLGWQPGPSPGRPGNGGVSFDADADTPHRDLNNLALARLDCWVPGSGSTTAAQHAAATRQWHTGESRRLVAHSRCERASSASCPKASRTLVTAATGVPASPTPRSIW